MLETSARLLRLLSLLQSRPDWTGAELAERLGVTTRTMLGWTLGTGVPLVGLIIVGIFALADPASATKTKLSVSILVLGGIQVHIGHGGTQLG